MGIYISGVKGLPEQVQENKNKIKEVEEQIEGIDFEAVRQLQGQVAENTQDINNLEASIGVQNQAINTLNNDVDALESKTQLMSYNDDLSKTDFRNSIEVADDVITRGLHVSGDGTIANSNGSGLHFQEGPNDDTLTIANKDGATPHYLQLDGSGNLTLDGQAVGGNVYRHNIVMSKFGGTACEVSFVIENSSDVAFTNDTLKTYINANHDNWTKGIPASGHQGNNIIMFIFASQSDAMDARMFYISNGALTVSDIISGYASSALRIIDTIESV